MRETITAVKTVTDVRECQNTQFAEVDIIMEVLEYSNPLTGVPSKNEICVMLFWDYVERKFLLSVPIPGEYNKIPKKAKVLSDKSLVLYDKLVDLNMNPFLYFEAFKKSIEYSRPTQLKEYIEKNNINLEKIIMDFRL